MLNESKHASRCCRNDNSTPRKGSAKMNHVDIALQYANTIKQDVKSWEATTATSLAQVHATLALAEQQRIANLIAIANLSFGPGDADMTKPWTSSNDDKSWNAIRAEVVDALGIKEIGNQ